VNVANTVSRNAADPDITESERFLARATGLIPAWTQTLAKGPGQYVRGVAPTYLRKGRGARVRDVDGNEYIDWSMAIGPVVLGYSDPDVDAAIRRQLDDGITFSLMHPLEVEVAEMIRARIPNAEQVRFAKSGAEATSAAVRIARAFTGRSRVVCCGYHGWHDWYITVTDRHRGVPEPVRDLTSTFDYNNLDSLARALDEDTACVILEPVVFEAPREGFLEGVRSLCRKNGSLLIFDEMWTGFRLAVGGAQERFGVSPDLATYSKAIANGMPLSVLTGRADVMGLFEKDVFFFSTFGGEALSLAAAQACIAKLSRERVPEHLERVGRSIADGYNRIAAETGLGTVTRCHGMACRTLVSFDPSAGDPLVLKSFVQQELLRHGILWGGTHTVCLAHSDADARYLLEAYAEILPRLADAIGAGDVGARLRGKPVEPVFRRTSQFDTKPRR
jgi:glutamate-1-semialdehyde 2,1-aminomutase